MTSRLVRQTLVAATLVTVGGNVVGRLFGCLREAVVAKYFGTSALLDTFVIAFTVPEILTFVIFAALPTAVIRSSQTLVGQDQEKEAALFRKGLAAFGLSLLLLTTALFLLKEQILIWLAPNLRPELEPVALRLLGILASIVFFRGLEAYFRAWLFRKKHFVAPALSPLVLNAAVIASLVLPIRSVPIEALACGWLVASILLFLLNGALAIAVIGPGALAAKASVRVAPVLRMTLAVAAIEAAFLVFPAIDRFLAARYLGDGEIAALRYALFLSQIAPGMLVVTFSSAAFPWITDMAASVDLDKLRQFYQESLRLVLFVILPVVAGLIIFSREIILVAFQRGAFNQHSVELAAGPLVCYSLGLVFYSVYFYQIRYYYAKQLLPRLGAILSISLIIKLVASVILVSPLGRNGLALATSIAWLASCIMMTIDLGRIADLRFARDMAPWLTKVGLVLAASVLAWALLQSLWPVSDQADLTARFVQLAAIGVSGLIVYAGLALAFRLPEAGRLAASIRRRFDGS